MIRSQEHKSNIHHSGGFIGDQVPKRRSTLNEKNDGSRCSCSEASRDILLEEILVRGQARPAATRVDISAQHYNSSTEVKLFVCQFYDVAEQGGWAENTAQLKKALKDLAYEVGRGKTVDEFYEALYRHDLDSAQTKLGDS